uniref:Uncharacterized protein n=1 Tax=Oryza nivara TaxID=4536 RepID=A0A0E0IZY4_ORYNI
MDECKTGDFGKRPIILCLFSHIKAMEKLSYDAICSGARCIEQQGNNSNMSCSDALQQYHSKSFNPRLIDDISKFASGSQENILTQHTEKMHN